MRARGLTGAALVVVSLAGTGCDWRDFDHLKSETPVLAVGGPSGIAAKDDFGRHLLALSGPAAGETGGRFVVATATDAELAVMSVDAHGNVKGQGFSSPLFGTAAPTLPITSMAEVPGAEKILLGAPEANTVGSVYVLTMGATLSVSLLDSPATQERFGLGVAAGALAGDTPPDYVVLSGGQLSVYIDGDPTKAVIAPDPPATCPLELSTGILGNDRANRAVLVAPLAAPVAGAGTQQIVVGTPSDTDQGAVSVFGVDPTTGVATCLFTYRHTEPRFGHALAIGDFDHDGVSDLLVGAPPSAAYWIRGPLAADSPIAPAALGAVPAGTQELGFSVAALDLDGDLHDEALVADPSAVLAGNALAGDVRVATGTGLAMTGTTLERAAPAASDAFGAAVAALPFCTGSCDTATPQTTHLPLIGAAKQTYLFFKSTPMGVDPRVK
ncbi:MAG TPA: FG-GAP repeat protein [Polyangia bacterium]|nr:FG-GAP repeat protein [Polyangia bacterium]